MKFRVRPGFLFFRSVDAAIEFESHGSRSGVVPRRGGSVVELTPEQVGQFICAGTLGMYDPVDEAAVAAYGSTQPIVARNKESSHG
jgi:hypothetical protein